MTKDGLLLNIADAGKVAPFQPWAKGLYEYRQKSMLRDDPTVSCLPPSGPRQFEEMRTACSLSEAATTGSGSS